MAKQTYSEKSIKHHDTIEAIQHSPGMYLGDMTDPFASLKEVLDNCGDEALAGHVKHIYCRWDNKDHEYVVCDDGRGIPVGKHPTLKISTLIAVFTKEHTGGKFERELGAYNMSVGTHGVGAKASNALAKEFEVWTFRDKAWWHVKFEYGRPVSKVEKVDKPYYTKGVFAKQGTQIRAVVSNERKKWYDALHIDYTKVETRCFDMAYLLPGTTVYFQAGDKAPSEMCYPAGLKAFIADEIERLKQGNAGLAPMHEDPIIIDTSNARTGGIRAALCWTNLDEEKAYSYVNISPTPDHGWHYSGLCKAITEAVAAAAGGRKANPGYHPEDLRVGMVLALNTFVKDPKFNTQTKERLIKPVDVEQIVYEEALPVLKKFFRKHKELAQEIVKKARELRSQIDRFKDERKTLKGLQVKKGAKGILLGKFLDAPGCPPHKRELFLVEGDSALGPMRDARDPKFQAVLPLRGKILNTAKMLDAAKKGKKGLAEILKSKAVMDIIQAVGAGIGDECKVEHCRNGKILLMADADPDGQHIAALLITLFCELMRPLVEAGKVYVVDSPLFMAQLPHKHVFGHSKAELKRKLGAKDYERALKSGGIHRFKGHGESNSDQVREYAADAATRRLYQLRIDPKKGYTLVRDIMGEDVTFRKKLLHMGNGNGESKTNGQSESA